MLSTGTAGDGSSGKGGSLGLSGVDASDASDGADAIPRNIYLRPIPETAGRKQGRKTEWKDSKTTQTESATTQKTRDTTQRTPILQADHAKSRHRTPTRTPIC